MRVALYGRVSTTNGQSTENQLMELRKVAKRAGWEVVAEYTDEGVSGAKGRDKRPQFDALLKAAVQREFDLVAAWSVDRLGRSLQDLVAFLSELHGVGCDLYLHVQGLDTTTPAGKAMFQMLGVFAEFERSIIKERITAGLDRARVEGTKSGRPFGRPAIPAKARDAILAARADGLSIRETARSAGVSVGKAHGVIKEAEAKAAS